MSSYRGAWDGGPPGAEAEYAAPQGAAGARALPATDPWTGASYSQYGAPPYDYGAYGAYSYGYDPSYYQQQADGTYYKYPVPAAYGAAAAGYDYAHSGAAPVPAPPPAPGPPARPRTPSRSRTPERPRDYGRRHSYTPKSRSVSPYESRTKSYSRKRSDSYDKDARERASRSTSRRKQYSSSDRSRSRSRSYSRVLSRKTKKKRSRSSDSSTSDNSYKKSSKRSDNSLTPPFKGREPHARRRSTSQRTPDSDSYKRSDSRNKEVKRHSSKDIKIKDIKREVTTPPRKRKVGTPPRSKRSDRYSVSPPKSYKISDRDRSSITPPKSYKYRDNSSDTPPQRKVRDSSFTPPKSYARSRSSSSKSSSEETSGRSKKRRARRSSSSSSSSSHRSRSKTKRKTKRNSPSQSGHRSRSRSKRRSDSAADSRSPATHEGTPSEDERRGQFTVADRKLFWKKHRHRQEEKHREPKTPPKEPPPGAVEATKVDDIEYGDPPDVEGPNFAELLPPPDLAAAAALASTSKSKIVPLPIKNDGSFLEMFKKMQEATKKVEEAEKKPEIKKPILPFIGKRRGGRVLKTGLVKKAKAIDEQTVDNTPKDAWSLYMQEVKKYRETSCEEERKTRPLVNKMPEMIKSPADIKTAPFDPRFPNTNQTRQCTETFVRESDSHLAYCHQSYLDFHRCQKVRGENYEPCQYFKRVYRSMCPNEWVDKWDTQRSEGTFPGRI